MSTRPIIAVQMYTLRDAMSQDAENALRQVAAMGYEGVELAGYGNLDATAIKRLCDELGLKVVSTHTGVDALRDNFNTIVDDALLLDSKHITIAWSGEEYRSREGALTLANSLNELGAKLNSAGIQLLYHNHDFEFARFDGEYMLDLVFDNTDANLVATELDCFWVQKGGVDPASYIRKYKGRTPLLHIKDMKEGAEPPFAEIGEGSLNWPEIFAAAEEGGVTAYVVEQDSTPGDPFDSVRLSAENLKKMGKLG